MPEAAKWCIVDFIDYPKAVAVFEWKISSTLVRTMLASKSGILD